MKTRVSRPSYDDNLLPREAQAKTRVRHLNAVDVFGGSEEVIIEHLGQFYHLRITRNGKLILTK